ncbi:MAG: hypothetical protein WD696_07925 [Bryobacteraceae bacterium]
MEAPLNVPRGLPGTRRKPGKALAFLLAASTLLQAGPAAPAEHRWIVLVDVSLSSNQADRDVSLRNELLSLSQILLGAAAESDTTRRNFLKVFFFGDGVHPAGLPPGPLRWGDSWPEYRWGVALPRGMGGRTELNKAIERAAEEFESMPAAAAKHLLIVSDGELDVGPHNRRADAPFQPEERTAYRGIFESTGTLRTLDVAVYTIAIDELAGTSENGRREEIRTRLQATGGANVQEQFLRLLDHIQKGEGPYFLHALAESLYGRSRSVLSGNILDAVWQTIFPQAVSSTGVAPGSRALVVFARANEPVRLCLEEGGGSQSLLLRYDAQTRGIVREPPDSNSDVHARRRATSQYATWLIDAPQATCVEPRSAYHGNNVDLRWLPDKPVHAGDPLAIELHLWKWSEHDPSLEWWRTYMSEQIQSKSVTAVATVSPPEGPPIPVVLEAKVTSWLKEVLVLTGRLPEAAVAGSYRIGAKLVVGDSNRTWEETVAPKTFHVGERRGMLYRYRLWSALIVILSVLAALWYFRAGYNRMRG